MRVPAERDQRDFEDLGDGHGFALPPSSGLPAVVFAIFGAASRRKD
jgi:hypothetical protein